MKYLPNLCLIKDLYGGSEGKESVGGLGLIAEFERLPGEGNSNPLQYSCMENSMDRGGLKQREEGDDKGRDG